LGIKVSVLSSLGDQVIDRETHGWSDVVLVGPPGDNPGEHSGKTRGNEWGLISPKEVAMALM
jgi:hypothetical protein